MCCGAEWALLCSRRLFCLPRSLQIRTRIHRAVPIRLQTPGHASRPGSTVSTPSSPTPSTTASSLPTSHTSRPSSASPFPRRLGTRISSATARSQRALLAAQTASSSASACSPSRMSTTSGGSGDTSTRILPQGPTRP